jgi:hypothetical protein
MQQRLVLSFLSSSFLLLCSAYGLLSDPKPPSLLYQEEPQIIPVPLWELPWFTGPLLAPSGHVIPVGHANIEPYLFVNVATGAYDKKWKAHSAKHNFYNINTEIPIQIGILPRVDFTFTPQFSYNHTSGASHWAYNDMPIGFDVQLYYDTPGVWVPAMKLAFKASVPFGKYQKLDPHDKGTDIGGSGSWQPSVGLVFSNLLHISGVHFLASRLALFYTVPNSVHVKNLNAYGGGHGTYGTVYPGPSFSADFAFEYTLARHWAFSFDALYEHFNHTRFKGRKGKTDGVPNAIGAPSAERFSLAPALEYNFNGNYGIIAGVWFSVAGRNRAEFINGVIALNIYK